ncbi:O-antigen ligase family protein [Rossellomorea aquimaris]|uniref:O-antigen ligase family protein n=1 Tax=Rossellomorea aquimaris TaxID=189382 RepID=UPI001CD27293|nr:O-antigen ligase family protein [Rossellomorea aquimaris]MCA1055172.1 O-antigen ligase family protein [Rossellomorea aquimaris]
MLKIINNKKFVKLFLLFIILQPVIDIFTTFSLVKLNSTTTFGILIRVLYMIVSLLFIFLNKKNSKLARNSFYYLILLGVAVSANLLINYFTKTPFFIGLEIKFFIKVIYLNIVFFNLLLVFSLLKKSGENIKNKAMEYVVISSLIISFSMIVSLLTSTSLKSYESAKIGYTGWFYAGNEIGAIISIILPVLCLYAITKTRKIKHIYYWIPSILASFSLLILGTKVGYGSILLTLLATAFICTVLVFIRKDLQTKINIAVSYSLLLILLVSTPFTPVFNNINVHMEFLGIGNETTSEQIKEEDSNVSEKQSQQKIEKKEETKISKKQVQNLVLSSREDYLAHHLKDYLQSPISQKLLGLGFAGNYSAEDPKMIEMDFFDLFFSFGIIGFTLLMAPMIFFLIKVTLVLFNNIRNFFSPNYFLLLTSVILTLGIAYFAGHVFTAPAVSIYFALILAMLAIESKDSREVT